jgi:bacillithiol system protein YtxJ
MPTPLDLHPDPRQALDQLRAASRDEPVVVFKKSPICPTSHRAEFEFRRFLEGRPDAALTVAWIDVIGERALARGLTAELGVQHESPQALWFADGELVWHASHGALNQAAFAERLAGD